MFRRRRAAVLWLLIALLTGPSRHGSTQSRDEFRDGTLVVVEVILCVFPRDFRGEPFSDVTERPNPVLPLIRVRADFADALRASADLL